MASQQNSNYNIIQPLILSACIAIGMMVGYKMNERPDGSLIQQIDKTDDGPQMVGRIEELIRFVENKYVDSINTNELVEEAVQAVFTNLDPHSVYLSPNEVADISEQMSGSFLGIGIENYMIDDTVNIYKIIGKSPAEKAGLKVFDKIVSINDSVVAGNQIDFETIRALLRQEKGNVVKLGIIREKKNINIDVVIDEIPLKTVTSYYIPEIETAYIKLDRFGSKTYKEFMEEVEIHFSDKKSKHLIIDLRDNPGGYLPEATNILCQIFEEKDRLLVYTEGKNNKRNEYKSNGKRFFSIDQVVVLIDENSASASEIVAGAIQDWDRGHVIGRRSYGKGLVQEQYELNNGGAIRLTVARYFTASGRSIQRDYSDKDHYKDDFTDRYFHGDLFYRDSSLIKDSSVYFTKILKRPVSASGGITPDIFIPFNNVYQNQALFEASAYLNEFVFKYVSKNKFTLPTQSKELAMWKIPDAFYQSFLSFLKEKSFSQIIKLEDLKGIEGEVKKMMGELISKSESIDAEYVKNDPFIQKAITTIKTKAKL